MTESQAPEGAPALLAALGQASFCLRELLPDHPDAKFTVSMIEAAIAAQPALDLRDDVIQSLQAKNADLQALCDERGRKMYGDEGRAPAEGDATAEQADAWLAICGVLSEVNRGWHANGETGMAAAVATIRHLASVQPKGTPVAWCGLTAGGQIAYFDGKPMVMPGPVGNDCHPHPLYLGAAQAPAPAPVAQQAVSPSVARNIRGTASDLIAPAPAQAVNTASLRELADAALIAAMKDGRHPNAKNTEALGIARQDLFGAIDRLAVAQAPAVAHDCIKPTLYVQFIDGTYREAQPHEL